MKIKIKYFAAMRETTGIGEEILESEAKTPLELFKVINQKYQFKIGLNHLKVAINENYVPIDTIIEHSDTVVFIPPVAGG